MSPSSWITPGTPLTARTPAWIHRQLPAGTLPTCETPWCAEKTVYAKRFWEAVANGSRVDKLVELPLHRDVPAAGYARLGGHTYRVEQTQTGEDGDGLPVTWLSLMRMEDAYDAY